MILFSNCQNIFYFQEFILDCYFRQIWVDKRLQFNSTDVDTLSMNWLFLEKVSKEYYVVCACACACACVCVC